MSILKLAVAAAVAVTGFSLPAAPAFAQHRDHDRNWRDDNGRHRGWERGRHRGWRHHRRYRACRWVWRNHHRYRICRWRYR
jgi:Ni/Co efflux regulator RcnB